MRVYRSLDALVGKAWAVAEIEHDIIDVAVDVARALEEGRRAIGKAINDLTKP